MRYRGPAADAVVAIDLEPFTALFHRSSGQTHLLVEPAPQLLDALAGEALTLVEVRDRLLARFDLPDLSDDGLTARLDELVEAGLVETR